MSGIREGAGIRIFVKIDLSHNNEKLPRGTLLCLTKFLVSEIFMDKRARATEGGSLTLFRQIFFCLTLPKISYGSPLAFHYFRVSKNVRDKGGRGITIFRQKFFVTVPKNYRETLLCFRMFRVLKNFVPKRGVSRFSIENLLSHSTEKQRR